VDFGDVKPADAPFVFPHAVKIQVISSEEWYLTVQAASDFIKDTDTGYVDMTTHVNEEESETKKVPPVTIPIKQLQWRPHSDKKAEWIPFQRMNHIITRKQPPTAGGSKPFNHDYRLDIFWHNPPGRYKTKLIYTLTDSLDDSFVTPNPFSPNGDGVDDVTVLGYHLASGSSITVRILTVDDTPVRTLLSGKHQSAGEHTIQWDGKSDSGSVVADAQYRYLIFDDGDKEITSGVIIVETEASKATGTIEGRVLKALNNHPLPGAIAQLYEADGNQVNSTVADDSGSYSFTDVPEGTYYLAAELKQYYSQKSETFILTDREKVIKDIFLSHNAPLFISKTASVQKSEIGDIITYTVIVRNIGTVDVELCQVKDIMPQGFQYIEGTTRQDGKKARCALGGNSYIWHIGSLSEGDVATLTYQVLIGANALMGEQTNLASIYGHIDGNQVSAGPAAATVWVKEGGFREKGAIIGKVYNDRNENGEQDAGEEGVAKAALVMEDGTAVIADYEGRYSIPDISAGGHMVMLNEIPLLKMGMNIANPIVLQTSISKFITVPQNGIARANFGVKLPPFFAPPGEGQTNSNETIDSTNTSSVETDDAEQSLFTYKRNNKALLFLGLAEYQMGHPAVSMLQPHRTSNVDARLAFYLKGKKDDYELKAAFDSAKSGDDSRFAETTSENYYPIYGDNSSLSDDTRAYGKFHLKFDTPGVHLLYGEKSIRLVHTQLAAYERTLPIARADYENNRCRFTVFGATSGRVAKREEVPGRGISGPYFLNEPPIPDTEHIEIELRDGTTGRIISTKSQIKGTDYAIDYDTGSITFTRPVSPGRTLDRAYYIVATYEYLPLQDRQRHYSYGARGTARISNLFTLGSTYISESQSPEKHRLFGADAILNLYDSKLNISSEYAQTNDDLSSASDIDDGGGRAYSGEILFRPIEQLKLKTFYRRIGSYFDNTINPLRGKEIQEPGRIGLAYYDNSHLTRRADLEEYGFKGDYKFTEKLFLSAQYKREHDNLEGQAVQTIKKSTSSAGLEYQYPEGPEIFINCTMDDDKKDESPVSLTQRATIGAFYPFEKVDAQMLYSLANVTDRTGTTPGNLINLCSFDIKFEPNENIQPYARYGLSVSHEKKTRKLASSGHNVVIGTDVRINENLLVIGLFDFGRSEDYLKYTTSNTTATSVGLKYHTIDRIKCSAKYEIRRTSSQSQFPWNTEPVNPAEVDDNIELKLQYRFGRGVSALAEYTRSNTKIGDDKKQNVGQYHSLLALAYRPLSFDTIDILTKYESENATGSIMQPTSPPAYHIISAEAIYTPIKHTSLLLKYARKRTQNDLSLAITNLIISRLSYEFYPNFDLTGEYRILSGHIKDDYKKGCAIELGYGATQNLRFAFGYNLAEYVDLRNQLHSYGPYFRITGKLTGRGK